MASKKTTSTKSSAKKSKGPAGKGSAKRNTPPPPAPPAPVKRELGGIVFLLLGVFISISYFSDDGSVIYFISNFIKGLIGYGYWLTAPACFLSAGVLFLHNGRPVGGRVFTSLLLPVFFGALADLFFATLPLFNGIDELVPILFVNGQHLQSGGAVGGLLSYGLKSTLSVYGALLVLVIVFVFCLLRSLNTSFMGLVGTVNAITRPEYDPEDYVQGEPVQYQRNTAPAAVSRINGGKHVIQDFVFPEIGEDEEPVMPQTAVKGRKGKAQAAPAIPQAISGAGRTATRKAAGPALVDLPLAGDEEDEILPFGAEGSSVRGSSSRTASAASPRRSASAQPKPVYADIPVPVTEEAFDDSLDLFTSSTAGSNPAKAAGTAGSGSTSRRTASRATVQTVSRTDHVKPLSAQEAAELAGITLEETPAEKPVPKSTRSVKVSAAGSPASGGSARRSSTEDTAQAEQDIAAEIARAQENHVEGTYEFPPTDLLRSSIASRGTDRSELAEKQLLLENALHSFGVPATISNVINGPTVTRYDFKLKEGVKLSKITNLSNDIALALGVINVRIAPVPDEISMVGIEVPNKIVSTVYLRDLVESEAFRKAKSKLTFSLGKDIGGNCIVGNISKLPHLLIAGTTGSGKSVCMNSLILSILYKASPEEVKFIMIDPKMVELGIYNGIPHLYVPVVTDPKKAAGALQWSVVEMLKRYRLFSESGVRELEAYNALCVKNGEDPLPRVVVIIDELADLMMVASKEVEESICRVAQMGRAAGMHLVVATQRPSADVITGLMKANIPSRIAFAVSSSMESRIILDQVGAEKLVGMGDMLFSPVGLGKPVRIQGAFVSDDEREDVINFIKETAGTAETNNDIAEFMDKAAAKTNEPSGNGKSGSGSGSSSKNSGYADDSPASGYDEMLPQAVEVVLEMKQCSVSMLQRRLKLGYSRAARVVDQLEEIGVVGPYEGAKPRSVVIDRNGWNEMAVQLGYSSGDDYALAAEMSEAVEEEIP